MFSKSESLQSLPDISKWNLLKIKNMEYLFYNCYSLNFIPDISNWNLSLVYNINIL